MSTLAKRKSIALVLGGTPPHIALIENLKSRGYFTVLVDYYDDPPAKHYADRHIKESAMDKAMVLDLAIMLKASLVISISLDQAMPVACYVAERLGLPAPYLYQTAVNVSEKSAMKRLMEENAIPTPGYCIASRLEEIELSQLTFPLMVKPTDCTGSIAVNKANDYESLCQFFETAAKASKNGKVVIESFIEGEEHNNYFIVTNGKPKLLMVNKRYVMSSFGSIGSQHVGTVAPISLTNMQTTLMKGLAKKIADALGLVNSPLQIQTISNNHKTQIIEFAARVGGGDSFKTIKRIAGIDMINFFVDCYLGCIQNINSDQIFGIAYPKPNLFLATSSVYAQGGKIKDIQGLDNLVGNGIISSYTILKRPGTIMDKDFSAKNKAIKLIIESGKLNELFTKVRIAMESIDIISTMGVSILRKDIFLREI